MTDVSSPPAAVADGAPSTPLVAGRLLDLVDTVVDKGRSATLAVERAARVARKLPALLFGVTLALAGLTFLVLAALRGAVEVTDPIFGDQRPWVAWLALGIIFLVVALVVGTLRNRGKKAT